jgi:hypothetical protein
MLLAILDEKRGDTWQSTLLAMIESQLKGDRQPEEDQGVGVAGRIAEARLEAVLIECLSARSAETFWNQTISKTNQYGHTMAHLAVIYRCNQLLRRLISWGIDLDIVDGGGCTALHYAYMTAQGESVAILIEAKANHLVVDDLGRIPAELNPRFKEEIRSHHALASAVGLDQAPPSASTLNEQARTSLYQQCSVLRTRLLKLRNFAPYLDLVTNQDKDVVYTLWDCFALGTPLCFLYNLLHLPGVEPIQRSTDPAFIEMDNPKEKTIAAKKFILGVQSLKKNGQWNSPYDAFDVLDLLEDTGMNRASFRRVVGAITYLLDILPSHVWMQEEVPNTHLNIESDIIWESQPSPDGTPVPQLEQGGMEAVGVSTLGEIIDTERKYVQDMEVMQVRTEL